MADRAGPYGLKYHSSLMGGRGAGVAKPYPIASGYATSIFKGDVVKKVNDGTIAKDTGTTTLTPLGVFDHVEYYDSTLKEFVWSNMWPASTTASDITAYVIDDPNAIFMVQSDAALTQTHVFNNIGVTQGTGNSNTGVSGVSLTASTAATTNTLPLTVIDIVKFPGNVGSTYTDVLVKWNAGHQHNNTTGV